MDVTPGIRSDATKVIKAYRRTFTGPAKALARQRIIEALHAAGVTVVLDFWGGGISARELMAAGFRVICVENGSMKLRVNGQNVSAARKQRAFEMDASDGGFTAFWGSAIDALSEYPEIDGAFLDYCGPWKPDARETVHAARHVKLAVITLMPNHDISTGATSIQERQLAYQLFLKMAWAKAPRWGYMSSSGCRILTDYDAGSNQRATVYLMGKPVRLRPLDINERSKMRGDIHAKKKAIQRRYYNRLSPSEKRLHSDRSRHNEHLRSARPPVKPCSICGLVRQAKSCPVCSLAFTGSGAKKYCSVTCAKAYKASYQRERRVAAVSGTTAEAIFTERAA